MKKNILLITLATSLACSQILVAQPFNFGNHNHSPIRPDSNKDKEAYSEEALSRWAELKKNFTQRKRKKDPFGSNMNPSNIKILPPQKAYEDILTPPIIPLTKKIPLRDALKKFKPNLISAAQQVVLVGSRTLHVGDLVTIRCGGTTFNLRIVKISANQVEFINPSNQEKGKVREYEYNPISMEGDDIDFFEKNQLKKSTPLLIE